MAYLSNLPPGCTAAMVDAASPDSDLPGCAECGTELVERDVFYCAECGEEICSACVFEHEFAPGDWDDLCRDCYRARLAQPARAGSVSDPFSELFPEAA